MTRRNPRSGITLLETMIALLIMAMTASLLASALGSGLRSFDRGARITVQIETAIARHDVRLWLEHALPAPVPGDPRPIFHGTASQLEFLAQPTAGSFRPGQAAHLILGHDGPLAIAAGFGTDSDTPLQTSMRLAPEATTLRFSFWGQIALDQPPAWHDAWPAGQSLPEAVRITFSQTTPQIAPIVIRPGKAILQSEMSLSSLVPPVRPSRP